MAPKANRTVAIARESIKRHTILEGKIKALRSKRINLFVGQNG